MVMNRVHFQLAYDPCTARQMTTSGKPKKQNQQTFIFFQTSYCPRVKIPTVLLYPSGALPAQDPKVPSTPKGAATSPSALTESNDGTNHTRHLAGEAAAVTGRWNWKQRKHSKGCDSCR